MRRPAAPIELEISGLAHDGRGVGKLDGKTVFVSGALPGERVIAQPLRRRRQVDEAQALEVLVASPDRVEPPCPHFGVCGGCALQHQHPVAQITAKQQVLAEAFNRIGAVQPTTWLAPLTGPFFGYRRRARLGVKWVEAKGRALVGFRERDPRFVADLTRCLVLVPEVGERIAALGALISDLAARTSIPQIEVAQGDSATLLVFRHLQPLDGDDRGKLIAFGRQHDLGIVLQSAGPDSLEPLDGVDLTLDYRLDDGAVQFLFTPLDFVQVNAAMNEAMVARAIKLLEPTPQSAVLDLFCGLGNFSLPLARRSQRVVGVEGDAGLVARARQSAAANGLDNLVFFAADLTAPEVGQLAWARAAYDRVLIDPPRSGASEVLGGLNLKAVERLVYVSCHPASLARDAGLLVRNHGFVLDSAGVMDMFPMTAHVESIALFVRGKKARR